MAKKKGMLFGILIISLIAVIGFASAASQCASSGKHGVEIAGYCFDCGGDDGICPIYFGVSEALCPSDPNCPYSTSGYWSLTKDGSQIISSSGSPLLVNIDDGKTLYLIVTNTGKASGSEITLNISENDLTNDDLNIASIKAKVDANGKATGNWTLKSLSAENEAEGILEFYFTWAENVAIKPTLFVNASHLGITSTATCGGYTTETTCEAVPKIEKIRTTAAPPCVYNSSQYCNWNETSSLCQTMTSTEKLKSGEEGKCTQMITVSCSYNEGEPQGNCDAGDDFFTVSYTSTDKNCPSWDSGAIPCGQKLRVPFFGMFGFIASIIVISFVYLVLNKRKKF